MFQTYPIESFILPEKFEAMLGIRRTCTRQDTTANFVSRVSFEDQCVSRAILGIQTIRYDSNINNFLLPIYISLHTSLKDLLIYHFRYNNAIEMIPCISSCTESTAKQCNMVTPFLAHIMVRYLAVFDTYVPYDT